ncbi:hypothetical protein SAMN02910265_01077 [Ruminococcus flavefaciens]|uniref:Uncharacterized protein n=1 Tax=Ruminococcus flavefaciens TaxID=1265 RepID=A0A1H6IME3_RUMFL|nr:hypothetical protein [Ruminococcus flavefaciens]SEH50803.1 hypothetical protein SAMN02910265_01077 [Ruminococcus flavefaciens]
MIINGEYIEKLSDEELCMLEQLTYHALNALQHSAINTVPSIAPQRDSERFIIALRLFQKRYKAIAYKIHDHTMKVEISSLTSDEITDSELILCKKAK